MAFVFHFLAKRVPLNFGRCSYQQAPAKDYKRAIQEPFCTFRLLLHGGAKRYTVCPVVAYRRSIRQRIQCFAKDATGIVRICVHMAYTGRRKQKGHSEEWPNLLILLVPPRGIEPRPDDYKSTARPSCYGGRACGRAANYSGR